MSDANNAEERRVPPETLEALGKTIFKQASEYGFGKPDWVRLVNLLLDLGMERSGTYTPPPTQDLAISEVDAPQDGSSLTVRSYVDSDFDLLNEWVMEADGKKFLATRTDTLRHETLEEVIADESTVIGIIELDGRPIGVLAYLNIDSTSRKAELRKLIADPSARGKGYATRAAQYWIEYGIATLGLRKIYLHTLDTNLTNIRLNERLGFRVEGLLRDEILVDDVYHDILRMSLILPH